MHCLYGCDRNKLAVELAKLSLWLESYAEGLPLTFLDHRLVHGDALTGPFFAIAWDAAGDGRAARSAAGAWGRGTAGGDPGVRREGWCAALNASIGRDVDDLDAKRATKNRLDQLLHPLRQLAAGLGWGGDVA